MTDTPTTYPPLPADDPRRSLSLAHPDTDTSLVHIGMVGDTYTITLSGEQTAGRFCVIDMHIPQGGGPGPHRHDFEETFIVLEGEVELTFRGTTSIARAGTTVNIPANAPHQFHNTQPSPARLLCLCAPAGNEQFFLELGVRVPTRTSPPPRLSPEEEQAFAAKAARIAPRYRTELLREA